MTKKHWALDAYIAHNDEVRQLEKDLNTERDRRYSEVNIEKEKALKIKETADRDALGLAREAQTYKDQQADKLRDKNLSESGIYATTAFVSNEVQDLRKYVASELGGVNTKLQELINGVSTAQGQEKGQSITWGKIMSLIISGGVFVSIAGAIVGWLALTP